VLFLVLLFTAAAMAADLLLCEGWGFWVLCLMDG